MIINTEKFIEVVRQHSILYDVTNKEYKNLRKKDKIWENISKIVGGNGNVLKKKWKNLRDSYGKYLRSEMPHMENNVNVVNRYKSWPWATHMEFLRPFFQFTRTIDVKTEIMEVSEDEIETKNQQESSQQKSAKSKRATTRKSNGKRRCEDTSPASTSSTSSSVKYLQTPNNPILAPDDDIDIIFMGYAKTLKKFSPRRQTMVKFKFSQILMEEELAQQEENEQTIIQGLV